VKESERKRGILHPFTYFPIKAQTKKFIDRVKEGEATEPKI